MKRALVVGIDAYPNSPLRGCVNDAIAVSQLLATNGDGSPNFSVRTLTSSDADVTNECLFRSIGDLFSGDDVEVAVFYFAGHGIISPETDAGYIVAQDGRPGSWGLSFGDILGLANRAHPKIRSSVIILDCCHSGYAGEVGSLHVGSPSVLGKGVTILTASHRDSLAAEGNRSGVFTDILIDGLQGGCSDVRGNITPASLYSHVDQTLGAWEQRPIYKANVQNFITLRQVLPRVSDDILRHLPLYFPDPTSVFPLDPSYEPDRQNVPAELRDLPVDEDHVRIFKELQKCNRHGLVVPVDAEHMYYAAIQSKGCRLTAIGAHFRKLAEMKLI